MCGFCGGYTGHVLHILYEHTGVSMRFSRYCVPLCSYINDAVCALTVMPRSLSTCNLSNTCSFLVADDIVPENI